MGVKLIRKPKRPPSELTEYLAEPIATSYEDAPKQKIREELAKEQGYLCAYCMARIRDNEPSMKIDHLSPQKPRSDAEPGGKALALYYRNMLGVCKGGEGRAHQEQHCDTHKGNTPISIDPTDAFSGWEKSLRYEVGRTAEHQPLYVISSSHAAYNKDLTETLNLNVRALAGARYQAIQGAIEGIRLKNPDAWTKAELERAIKRFGERDSQGRYTPFCEAIIFYLRKRLARAPR
jgi:uncharacterized protein (TIGR02646 family)